MSATRRGPLPVLFSLALLGVLSVLGAVVGELLGWPAAAAYSGLVLTALVLLARKARPAPEPERRHTGCACCGDEPWRGVEVV